MSPSLLEVMGSFLFAGAVVHTFFTQSFDRLAHIQPRHAGLWHLMGEVEVVFGLWAMLFTGVMIVLEGTPATVAYLESRDFTEPMFVFAIMVVAATRPVIQCAQALVLYLAQWTPLSRGVALYLVTLSVVPLLGSLITEPAAMTVGALLLRDTVFRQEISTRLKYATLGVLFVNISIGGTLTPFAAPPVLMVAAQWQWDLGFMMLHFGWKAMLIVSINAIVVTMLFQRELRELPDISSQVTDRVPHAVMAIHLVLLCLIVVFSHHPVMFLGLLLFFLGYSHAYRCHQDKLMLREALSVAFFLSGLVVLGGLQQWWLRPLLMSMDAGAVFWWASALTAVTDNAALTYLGSLVEGLSHEFKTALVAGAVTGGGLTLIANAPNPAGAAILKNRFAQGAIHPLGLLLAAIVPTLVSAMVFRLL